LGQGIELALLAISWVELLQRVKKIMRVHKRVRAECTSTLYGKQWGLGRERSSRGWVTSVTWVARAKSG
jgi:hypothetical protein